MSYDKSDPSFSENEIKYLIRALILNYADDNNVDNKNTRKILLDKIVGYKHWDFRHKIEREQYSFREPFREKLFLGSGFYSIVQKNKLHKRLEFAASELGGIQQSQGNVIDIDNQNIEQRNRIEIDRLLDLECRKNIRQVLKDIIFAFDFEVSDLIDKDQIEE